MSSPASPLQILLSSLGRDSITLAELMQHCLSNGLDHRQYIGETVGKRTSFWRRLKNTQHDPERVVLTIRPPNVPSGSVAGQHSSDTSGDPADVSEYMDEVLSLLQPCPNVPAEVLKVAADEYAHFTAELAKAGAGSTAQLHYKVDTEGRTISVSGMVHVHAKRDKDTAPVPHGGSAHKQVGDHKGHLYAATFAGDPAHADAFPNVVWETGKINLSFKKRFENAVAAFAAGNPGCVVTTIHEPRFNPGDGRPFEMTHYVVVNGVVVGAVILENK